MLRLLKIELHKNLPSLSFLVFLGIYLTLVPLTLYTTSNFSNNPDNVIDVTEYFQMPYIWKNVVYIASFFNFLLGFIIINRVCTEYNYRTMRQQIMDGLSREAMIGSKLITIGLLSLVSCLVISIFCLGLGIFNTPLLSEIGVTRNSHYLINFALHSILYMSIALTISIIIRRSGLSYMLFFCFWLGEFILGNNYEFLAPYLPFSAADNLIPKIYANVAKTAGLELTFNPLYWVVIVYIVLFIAISFIYFRRTDL